MNILFIHEVDFIKKVVFDVHVLPEALSMLGHEVYFIDYESMWDRKVKSERELDVSRAISDSKVHLIRPWFIKLPCLSRISAFISHYIKIKQVLKEKKIDAIVLYSVPTNGLQASYLANRLNIPIVFRSIDVLHELVTIPVLNWMTKKLEQAIYPRMDMVLTLTPSLSTYVINMGARKSRVKVLPMTVDTSVFKPNVDTGDLRIRWNLDEKDRIILFMGTLFEFSGLDLFLREMPKIMKKVKRVKLLIVGDGNQRRDLEEIITDLDLKDSVIITGFQPYQTMPQYINLADVCINTFIPNPTTNDIFPGKTVQFLACGKPLVNMPLAGVKAMLSGQSQGVIYANDIPQLADEVIRLFKSPEMRRMIGQQGLNYARRVFECSSVAKLLENYLKELVGE